MSSELYSDNLVDFGFGLTTAWFKPGAIQGFGRIWRILLEGFFPTATTSIQVQIAYDYDPTIVDTFAIIPNNPHQVRIFPSNTACESMQLTIQDSGSFVSNSKWALNSIDLEVGVRRGAYKKLGPGATL